MKEASMYSNIFKNSAASLKAWDTRGRGKKAGPTFVTAHPTMSDFFRRVADRGGFSYDPKTGMEPKTGFAVSIFPKHSFAVAAKKLRAQDLEDYVFANSALLHKPGNNFGGWHDKETGTVFLDVSRVVKTPKEARALSLMHDQKSYFDFARGKAITVNRRATSGGVIKGEIMGTPIQTKDQKPSLASLTLISGDQAMTVAGMERMWKSITGKDYTPVHRVELQKRIDAHNATNKKVEIQL